MRPADYFLCWIYPVKFQIIQWFWIGPLSHIVFHSLRHLLHSKKCTNVWVHHSDTLVILSVCCIWHFILSGLKKKNLLFIGNFIMACCIILLYTCSVMVWKTWSVVRTTLNDAIRVNWQLSNSGMICILDVSSDCMFI